MYEHVITGRMKYSEELWKRLENRMRKGGYAYWIECQELCGYHNIFDDIFNNNDTGKLRQYLREVVCPDVNGYKTLHKNKKSIILHELEIDFALITFRYFIDEHDFKNRYLQMEKEYSANFERLQPLSESDNTPYDPSLDENYPPTLTVAELDTKLLKQMKETFMFEIAYTAADVYKYKITEENVESFLDVETEDNWDNFVMFSRPDEESNINPFTPTNLALIEYLTEGHLEREINTVADIDYLLNTKFGYETTFAEFEPYYNRELENYPEKEEE
jgi:hypothetical protein